MYQLAIDIGNSQMKMALFNKEGLVQMNVSEGWHQKEYDIFVKGYFIKHIIVSDVRYQDAPYEEYLKGKDGYMRFTSQSKLPIQNKYETPETLGSDRLAVVMGARHFHKEGPLLVINSGTCITYDLLTKDDEYLGGAISPGFDMRLKAMNHFTGKLPLVQIEADEEITTLIGRNTRDAIISGAYYGMASEIDAMIDRFNEQYEGIKPVLTGGNWSLFAYNLKNRIFAHPNLVLFGLNAILDYYVKNND
jgi:type III pantothenate kinase